MGRRMQQRLGLSMLAVWAIAAPVSAQTWVQQGPSPTINGQVEGMREQSNPVAGSISALLTQPPNSNMTIAGATGGGIWTTSNASGAARTATARGHPPPSPSIGALAWDMNAAAFNTIWAGTA